MPIHPESRGSAAPYFMMAAAALTSWTLVPHVKEKPETKSINERAAQLALFVVREAIEPKASESITANFLRSHGMVFAHLPEINRHLPSSPETPALEAWLDRLRNCESGGNYQDNTGNGYYGAYQFSQSTWDSLHTGYPNPIDAPTSVQNQAIITNTIDSKGGLSTQNPGCYEKGGLSEFPPK